MTLDGFEYAIPATEQPLKTTMAAEALHSHLLLSNQSHISVHQNTP
jgi:hypothetical protein